MSRKVVATNRRAKRDFELFDAYECGLQLRGSEVKSLRDSKLEIAEAYGRIQNNELWLISMHIPRYVPAGLSGSHDPDRPKKLLAHRKEIENIRSRMDRDGLTLIPLSVYFVGGKAKVELSLARRKKKMDHRADKAERESSQRARRAVRRSAAKRKQAS